MSSALCLFEVNYSVGADFASLTADFGSNRGGGPPEEPTLPLVEYSLPPEEPTSLPEEPKSRTYKAVRADLVDNLIEIGGFKYVK